MRFLAKPSHRPDRHLTRPLPGSPYDNRTGLAGGTLLIVEDDRVINDGLAARLRAEGFTVAQAYDGPGGVAVFEREQPDLVVLDVMLPGSDGNEVCRRIQGLRPVPVLMLTARDDESDVLVALTVGADDYVTKPFRVREVVARTRALLRRSSVPASWPRRSPPVESWFSRLGRIKLEFARGVDIPGLNRLIADHAL